MIDSTSVGGVAALLADLLGNTSSDELIHLLKVLGPIKVAKWFTLVDPADMPSLLEQVDPVVLRAMVLEIYTPQQTRVLIDMADDSDALIEQFGARTGFTMILDRIFQLANTRLVPERLAGEHGTMEWYIRTPEDVMTYHLDITDGEARGDRGPAVGKVDVTIAIGYSDMLRLAAGLLDGVAAFLGDRIEATGDLILAAKVAAAFNTTAGAV